MSKSYDVVVKLPGGNFNDLMEATSYDDRMILEPRAKYAIHLPKKGMEGPMMVLDIKKISRRYGRGTRAVGISIMMT